MLGPQAASAGLDATSPSNPLMVSLAKGRHLPDEGRLTAGYGDGAAHGKAPGAYGAVQRAQAVIVMPPPPPVAAAPIDDPALAAAKYISRALQSIFPNQAEEPDQSRSKLPVGSRPIDKTQWAGDHQAIKKGIGAGSTDDESRRMGKSGATIQMAGGRTTDPPGIIPAQASRVVAQAVIGRDNGDNPDGQ